MRKHALISAATAMVAAVATVGLTACAASLAPAAASLPEPLRASSQEVYVTTLAARGVQIYECRAETDKPSQPGWAFVAPEAELLDGHGRSAGHHGAGPFWQVSDGSRIVGSVKARADEPAAAAIPWLLLATRAQGGPASGLLARVSSVQRVNTQGGVAPALADAAHPCTAQHLGQRARVPYSADYHFYAPR